jgi:HTH-type transcriptional regulator/antitoxin MqsA
MRHEKQADEIRYLGHKRTLKTLGWWCSKCGEAIFDGATLEAREKSFLELKAEVDGVLGPAEVAKIRTALGLSQRKASALLGGGPRAFQKYEAGTQALSVAMSHLLRLLAKDPARLRELSGPATVKASRSAQLPKRTRAAASR